MEQYVLMYNRGYESGYNRNVLMYHRIMMKTKVIEKVNSCVELIRSCGHGMPDNLEILFDLTGGCAGQAWWFNGRFGCRFNLLIMERHPDSFLARTVPHEVAHIAQFFKYGSSTKPHGREWKYFMSLLGADDSRCHNYDITGIKRTRRTKKYIYNCGCGTGCVVGAAVNRKIQQGYVYKCNKCKTKLFQVLKQVA